MFFTEESRRVCVAKDDDDEMRINVLSVIQRLEKM